MKAQQVRPQRVIAEPSYQYFNTPATVSTPVPTCYKCQHGSVCDACAQCERGFCSQCLASCAACQSVFCSTCSVIEYVFLFFTVKKRDTNRLYIVIPCHLIKYFVYPVYTTDF